MDEQLKKLRNANTWVKVDLSSEKSPCLANGSSP